MEKIIQQNSTGIQWNICNSLINILADKIQASGIKFDLIIGISKGGLIPAVMIGHKLGIKSFLCVGASHYEGNKQKKEVEIHQFPTEELKKFNKDANILLIDEIIDSGETVNIVIKKLKDVGFVNIVVATICYRNYAKIKPDFWAEEVKTWIIFPWE